MSRTVPHPPSRARRLLYALLLLTVVNTAAYAVDLALRPPWPLELGQLFSPVIAVLAVLLCRRALHNPATPPAARVVWRYTSWGMTFIAASITTRIAGELTGLSGLGRVATAAQIAGAVLLSYSLLRIPLGLRSRTEKVALALDILTVLVAAAAFIQHFIVVAALQVRAGDAAPAIGPIMGPALVAVVLAAKAAFSGSEAMPRRVLYLRAVSALVGGLGSVVGMLLAARPDIDVQLLLNPLASATIALSAWFQMTARETADQRRARRRRYSVLPYVAVAAVDALLVWTSVRDSPDRLLFVGAAVVLTALVVVRQLSVFRENDTLLAELGRKEQQLRHDATHDALTGLANRSLFGERVTAAVTRSGPLSIVFVDLDDFKTVNDTLGHGVGDALLVTVADRMRGAVRAGDTVARLGGDEFAILFEGLEPDAVDGILVRITEALLEPVIVEGHPLTARASFGVVEGTGGENADDLLRRADIAMYEAKERGEGGHQRYQPGMEDRAAHRHRLAGDLRTAIDGGELVLHYQPVVSLPEGRMTGVEALVRWQHPTLGLLAPGEFIDVAEHSGLIVPLGRWVLREATRQAAAWIDEHGGPGFGTVAVNASARQLQRPGFAAEVRAALHDSGLPAHLLTIEITESAAVGGGATTETLQALRAMGVRLALDDFGTGQSTLSLLATCPVDQIKLDRSFTPAPGPDAIAGAVLRLAQAMGIEAVAEGVETGEQARTLQGLGYAHAQGYHFARPMTPEQLAATYRRAVLTPPGR